MFLHIKAPKCIRNWVDLDVAIRLLLIPEYLHRFPTGKANSIQTEAGAKMRLFFNWLKASSHSLHQLNGTSIFRSGFKGAAI